MMTGLVVQDQNLEKQIEKQMGCMAGFFQIFDRHQAFTGSKRLYSNKRLPSSTVDDTVPEQEKKKNNVAPPAMSSEPEKQSPQTKSMTPELRSPEAQPKLPPLPLPLPILEAGNKSSWKLSKEAPRLSLDSRATFDPAKGSLKPREIRTLTTNCVRGGGEESDAEERRSPSVIARLMGLEQLPAGSGSEPDVDKKPELRRSASESRASRDLFHYRFIDGVNFQLKQSSQLQQQQPHEQQQAVKKDTTTQSSKRTLLNRKEGNVEEARVPQGNRGVIGLQRKCFFDSADFFPEQKQSSVSIYGEIEKRLKMRGIDEPSKDLQKLKQILDALQLKGLLHFKKTAPSYSDHINYRNFVYERDYPNEESPIVVMKPSPVGRRMRTGGEAMSPRREVNRNGRNLVRGRTPSSPTRSEGGMKCPIKKRETRGGVGIIVGCETVEQRRVLSPVQSPRVGSRRTDPDQMANRSPRARRLASAEEIYHRNHINAEDEVSTVSESSISTSSQTDTERSKVEEYKDGRSILERCDKLLHSIAEMTATATELQPSPVSVLDSSFYKEESSPSPDMKRNTIDFKDQIAELEDDIWSPPFLSVKSKSEENSNDCDYLYISDVVRASNCFPDDLDIFQLLEKQQYLKGKDTSKVSRLQRKLIFDTIAEILQQKRHLPPWKVISWTNPTSGRSSLQQVWSEFQRIRERDISDDLFEVICSVLRKDLSRDVVNGWGECPVEMSETVLDVERLIFKDLIGETIRDLAVGSLVTSMPRRKLVF